MVLKWNNSDTYEQYCMFFISNTEGIADEFVLNWGAQPDP